MNGNIYHVITHSQHNHHYNGANFTNFWFWPKSFPWLISLIISPIKDITLILPDLSSLGASLLSPILRNSDGDGDAPATKRRRLSVSSQEMLEHLVHRASPLPLVSSPRDRDRHHPSPPQGHQHGPGPYTRRQRNISRQSVPARPNQHRRRWVITLTYEPVRRDLC